MILSKFLTQIVLLIFTIITLGKTEKIICGSKNGESCGEGYCCNNGVCTKKINTSTKKSFNANIVFAIDNSSSMKGERIKKLNSALKSFVNNLPDDVEIAYTLFAESASDIQIMSNKFVPNIKVDTDSSYTNFGEGLIEAQNYLEQLNNGKEKVIVLFSDGAPEHNEKEYDDGVARANAINTANKVKDSGITIYTINVNELADAKNEPAEPGDRIGDVYGMGQWFGVNEDYINTVMHLISSNCKNVKTSGGFNGCTDIDDYEKVSSDYYLTSNDGNWSKLFSDVVEKYIIEESVIIKNKPNIVLVIDNSASMRGESIQKLNSALKELVKQLPNDLEIAYTLFSESATDIQILSNKIAPNIKVDTSSSYTNFRVGLIEAQSYLSQLNNGEDNIIILFSDGAPEHDDKEEDDGEARVNAINTANEIKDSGIIIYTINVNKLADASREAAKVGERIGDVKGMGPFLGVNEDYINTVMHLISSNYKDVKTSSNNNGCTNIDGYTKVSSNYYRTSSNNDWTSLFTEIIEEIVGNETMEKCNIAHGCEPDYGFCFDEKVSFVTTTSSTTTTTTTTSTPTTTTPVIPTQLQQCGSKNGESCGEGYCCNNGVCTKKINTSTKKSFNANIVFAIDNSSSMKGERIKKLNSALKSFVNNLPDDVEIAYTLFAESASDIQIMSNKFVPNIKVDTDSSYTNFGEGLIEAQNYLEQLNNGKEKVIVLFSDGAPEHNEKEYDDGVARANAINTANKVKDSGITIYTINVNELADAKNEPAEPGDRIGDVYGMGQWFGVNEDYINTVMHLISSNCKNVKTSGGFNGCTDIDDYEKVSSDYYLTSNDGNWSKLFSDVVEKYIIEESVIIKNKPNIVLVIDNSASMRGESIQKLNSALKELVKQLPNDLEIAYTLFSESATDIQILSNKIAPNIKVDTSSSYTNFRVGLIEAQSYLSQLNNGEDNIIILFSDGAPEHDDKEEDDGEARVNAINTANEIKDSGIIIYTINVNKLADASREAAKVGERIGDVKGMGPFLGVNEDYINTVMHLISSNYKDVKTSSNNNGCTNIDGYTKVSSNYYRTSSNNDWTSLFTEIIEEIVGNGTPENRKCYINNGCEPKYGFCYDPSSTTTVTDNSEEPSTQTTNDQSTMDTVEIPTSTSITFTIIPTTTTTATINTTTIPITTTTTTSTTTTTTTTTTSEKPKTTTTTTTKKSKTTTTTTTKKPKTTTTTTTTKKPKTKTTTKKSKTTTITTTTKKPKTTKKSKTTTTTTTKKPKTTTTTTTTKNPKTTTKSKKVKIITTITKKVKVITKVIKVSKPVSERCGKGYGSCKSSQCCSKQGWCGSTTKYCSKAQGCQSEFGKCW